MIRPINITLNAAHPELPLTEATTFTGSPSTVFIRGVPKSVGNWTITAVQVAVSYPDNSATTREAVESAEGVWVATLPGTTTSGRTEAGFRILASGIDENGATVTGYVLGFADFSVFSFLPVPAPGETFYLLRYFDAMPTTPKKGDATLIGGDLKFYNGTAWQPFTDLSNYYTAQETDEAIDALAAYYITYNAQGDNFPTRVALLNATTLYSGGAVRVPTRNDYAVVLADETHGGAEWRYIYAVPDGSTTGQWEAQYPIETNDYTALSNKPSINNVTLSGNQTGAALGLLDLSGGTITGNLVLASTENAVRKKISLRSVPGDGMQWMFLFSGTNPDEAVRLPTTSGTLALTSQLRYDCGHVATVSTGTTPTVTNLADRAANTATLGSTVTAATVTLPEATTGKMRDFYIRLIIQSSTAPTITFYDPATSATVTSADIPFGAPSLADIGPGDNIVLFTEIEANKWLVSVKHEEAAS